MTRITSVTLEQDAAVNFRNDLVRALRDQFGMSEKVAVLVLAEISAWSGNGYKNSLCITSSEVRELKVEAVLHDFNGRNHGEVMRKHGLSQRTLYRIIGGK